MCLSGDNGGDRSIFYFIYKILDEIQGRLYLYYGSNPIFCVLYYCRR